MNKNNLALNLSKTSIQLLKKNSKKTWNVLGSVDPSSKNLEKDLVSLRNQAAALSTKKPIVDVLLPRELVLSQTIVIEDTPSSSTPGDVYCQMGFGIIGRRDYLTLKHGEKITDEIINGMLHHQMQNHVDCYMFSSHFMSHYMSLSGPVEDKFERVARWTRDINLIAKKVVSVPVCKNDHWYLLVAMDLESNPSLTILNSVPDCGDDQQAAEAFIEYLRVGFQVSGVRVYRPLLPTQSTRNDCGAFVVLYQRHILEDTDEFKVT